MNMIHVANIYRSNNQNENERMGRAMATWRQLRFAKRVYKETKDYGRSSRTELGDSRDVAYVRDVLDSGLEVAKDNDVIVITNADSCLVSDCLEQIEVKIWGLGAIYSFRIETLKVLRGYPNSDMIKGVGYEHNGVDLIAMTKGWWEQNREKYPDLLLGNPGWDWVFRFMLDQFDSRCAMKDRVVWHEHHQDPFWRVNFNKNIGCLYNQRLCRKWAQESGRWKELIKDWKELPIYAN